MKHLALIALAATCSTALATDIEIVWTKMDGRTQTEHRALTTEKPGVEVFKLSRAEIRAKKVQRIALTPAFATARTGDEGFWVFSSGEYGTFRCEEGTASCNRWQLMSCYGMKTPQGAFAAIVRSLKYYFTTRVTARKGVYRMSCVLENELVREPYEDFEIAFHHLPQQEATLGGMARCYRNYQLQRNVCKPLVARVKNNPVLKQAIDSIEVRVRHGWKPVPPTLKDQMPENEPPVKVAVSFDRFADIVRACKKAGIANMEFCLVGWNIGGHDGRWPQVFPPEAALGGEARLRAAIKTALDAGYLVVPHGNYLDSYRIADCWDEEFLAKQPDNNKFYHAGDWGGGRGFRICPQRAHERFMSREMLRMKALGFKGLGYFDVASVVPAQLCYDPRHPVNALQCVHWWGKSAALSQECFGGFASEGSFDHFVGNLDYGLYASFANPKLCNKGLVDRMEMFPQLVYNGIFAMNPFTSTVNFTRQDKYHALKVIEFAGRPAFYFYSKFLSNGHNWMGDSDLGCATEAELAASVAALKKGAEIYAQLSPLQYVFLQDHACVSQDVWCTSYEDGTRLYVNYSDQPYAVEGGVVKAQDWLVVK